MLIEEQIGQCKHYMLAKEEILLEPQGKLLYKTIEVELIVRTKKVTYNVHKKNWSDEYEELVGQYDNIQDVLAAFNSIKLNY